MPIDGIENRIQDGIIIELSKIGRVGTDWLTHPTLPESLPPGETFTPISQPALWAHLQSTVVDPAASGSRHYWKSTFNIWCAANTVRELLSLKRDVFYCLYAAENNFTQEFGQPLYPQGFDFRGEYADTAGIFMGVITATIDYSTDHLTP